MSNGNDTYEMQCKLLEERMAAVIKQKDLELQLAMTKKEMENEVLLKDIEIKLAIEKEQHDKDVQLEKLKSERDLQIQKLTTDLALSNTERLKVMEMLDPRGAIEIFEKEKVHIHFTMPMSKKKELWIKYSKTEEAKVIMKQLGLSDEEVLADTVEHIHKSLNEYVHGTFYNGKTVCCSSSAFSDKQWNLLKAIWILKPYSKGTLQRMNIDGSVDYIV